MGDKRRRKALLLAAEPNCIFCGGLIRASEEDHVPPRAFFVKRAWPEGFVFSACEECNRGSRVSDQVCAFYVRWMDHDDNNLSDQAELDRLLKGMQNNHSDLLPRTSLSANEVRRALRRTIVERPVGTLLEDMPIVKIPKGVIPHFKTTCRKLLSAFYFKEMGKPLELDHRIWHAWQHVLDSTMGEVVKKLAPDLPNAVWGSRSGKNGQLFYRWASNDAEELFGFVARFGASFYVVGAAVRDGGRAGARTEGWDQLRDQLARDGIERP